MVFKARRFDGGLELGVIIGGSRVDFISTGGVFLYRPQNDIVPHSSMTKDELGAALAGTKQFFKVPYALTRQVTVDSRPVWRNKDCFDLRREGVNPREQDYWGRSSDVQLELRTDVETSPSDFTILIARLGILGLTEVA